MVKIRRGAPTRNVEYRGRARTGGTRMPFPMPTSRGGRAGAGAGGAGLVGVIVVIVITLLSNGGGSVPVAERNEFLEVVFTDVQDYWEATLPGYRRATMVIFDESVDTDGCGSATSAVGPFYCPADEHVYLDASFFDVLAGPSFGAEGDFAQAYVVAHEVAHHVQTVTAVSGETIRVELQADCLAGAWASVAARRPQTLEGNTNLLYLETGDLREGLAAAAAVGDDRIQIAAGRQVDPHNWTHGSAEQREAWFTLGLETGDPALCAGAFDQQVDATEVMPG